MKNPGIWPSMPMTMSFAFTIGDSIHLILRLNSPTLSRDTRIRIGPSRVVSLPEEIVRSACLFVTLFAGWLAGLPLSQWIGRRRIVSADRN
jgi:hypothetical protein